MNKIETLANHTETLAIGYWKESVYILRKYRDGSWEVSGHEGLIDVSTLDGWMSVPRDNTPKMVVGVRLVWSDTTINLASLPNDMSEDEAWEAIDNNDKVIPNWGIAYTKESNGTMETFDGTEVKKYTQQTVWVEK